MNESFFSHQNDNLSHLKAAGDEANVEFNQQYPEFKLLEDNLLMLSDLELKLNKMQSALYQDDVPHNLQELSAVQQQIKELKAKQLVLGENIVKLLTDPKVQMLKHELDELTLKYNMALKAQPRKLTIVSETEKKLIHAAETKMDLLENQEKIQYIPEALERHEQTFPVPLQKLASFFEWFPPLKLGLMGALSFYELYRLAQNKENVKLNVLKSFLIIATLGLTVAAFINPIGLGVVLTAAVMGAGFLKESVDFFAHSKEVKKIKNQMQSDQRALDILKERQKNSGNINSCVQQIKYRQMELTQQANKLQVLQARHIVTRNKFVLAATTMIGAVLCIFPPTAIIGAGILFASVCMAAGDKTGLFKSVWMKIKKVFVKPTIIKDEKKLTQDMPNSIHIQNDEKNIFAKLEQPRGRSQQEIKNLSIKAANSCLDDLHATPELAKSNDKPKLTIVPSVVKPVVEPVVKDDEDEGENHSPLR
jgi:hypothetical protein